MCREGNGHGWGTGRSEGGRQAGQNQESVGTGGDLSSTTDLI